MSSVALVPVAAASSPVIASTVAGGTAAGGAATWPLVAGASLAGALCYGACRKRRRAESGGGSGAAVDGASAERVASLEARVARAEERLARLEEERPAKAARLESAEAEQLRVEAATQEVVEREIGRVTGLLEQKATIDSVEHRLQGFKSNLQQIVDKELAGVWVRLGEKAHKTDVAQLGDRVSEMKWSLEDMVDKVEDVEHLDKRVSCLRDQLEEKADRAQFEQMRTPKDDSQQNLDSARPHVEEPVPPEKCCADARRMLTKYPDRIPVICEPVACSNLPCMKTAKLLVLRRMLCSEFKPVVLRHIQPAAISSYQSVHLSVGGMPLEAQASMSEIYDQYKAEDGFLRITCSTRVTHGSY